MNQSVDTQFRFNFEVIIKYKLKNIIRTIIMALFEMEIQFIIQTMKFYCSGNEIIFRTNLYKPKLSHIFGVTTHLGSSSTTINTVFLTIGVEVLHGICPGRFFN